jgi:hypothetical protein
MQVFRGAVIPSATGRSQSPPALPTRAGEPPPFSPFQSGTESGYKQVVEDRRRIMAPIRVREVGDGDISYELMNVDAVLQEGRHRYLGI